jgi:hypothetical protein
MSDAFEYRPKFVDIRVKKAGAAKAAAREPETQACDHVDCKRPGAHRAPKGRDRENEFWHFCAEHVAEYNKRWNYFQGMSEAELAAYRKKEEVGHRPTWTFRSGRLDRFSSANRAVRQGRAADPFAMFGPDGEPAQGSPVKQRRRLTRLQAMALEVLQLEENATSPDIRTRYAELVKRWHPDSNGGDRGAEENLQRVIKAYQTLKAGGLV